LSSTATFGVAGVAAAGVVGVATGSAFVTAGWDPGAAD
jgi:hypothetical protein